jgi:hypothetical protein
LIVLKSWPIKVFLWRHASNETGHFQRKARQGS